MFGARRSQDLRYNNETSVHMNSYYELIVIDSRMDSYIENEVVCKEVELYSLVKYLHWTDLLNLIKLVLFKTFIYFHKS